MSKALSASLEVPSSPGTYSAALEGLTRVNEVLMNREPIPPLYSTGARWEVRQGDPSETKWRYATDVAGDGWGDCQDLSAYRAAELRVTGQDPRAEVRVYPTGPNRYHAVVARGNGAVEDPSVILGMEPIPEAPFMTTQLPIVAGNGTPAQGRPNPLAGILSHLQALHPNIPGMLGRETGLAPKLARVRDVAPEVTGPTFHITPHVCGAGAPRWKGVHRIPLRDGTVIVGMTATYKDACDVIGDGAGLLSRLGNAILNHPVLSMLVSPEAYVATRALMDPGTQYALKSTADSAHAAAAKDPDSIWGYMPPVRSRSTSPGGSPSGGGGGLFSRLASGMVSRSGTPGGSPGSSPTGPSSWMGLTPPGAQTPGMPGAGMSGMPQGMYPQGSPMGMYPQGMPPGMPQYAPLGINPMTGMPFPAGTTAQGIQAAYAASQAQQSGGGGGGGGGGSFGGATAADFGLSSDPGTGWTDPNAGAGWQDADAAALASYTDPLSSPGYWNT